MYRSGLSGYSGSSIGVKRLSSPYRVPSAAGSALSGLGLNTMVNALNSKNKVPVDNNGIESTGSGLLDNSYEMNKDSTTNRNIDPLEVRRQLTEQQRLGKRVVPSFTSVQQYLDAHNGKIEKPVLPIMPIKPNIDRTRGDDEDKIGIQYLM